MNEATSIVLNDAETTEEAVIVIRYDSKLVALALSRKGDGDIEVVMGKEDAWKLLDALRNAVE